MSELQTLKCYLNQLPATILKLMGIEPPLGTIPEPVQSIVDMVYSNLHIINLNS